MKKSIFIAVNINDLVPGVIYLDSEDITAHQLKFVKYKDGDAWFSPMMETNYIVHHKNDDCKGLIGFQVDPDDRTEFYIFKSPKKNKDLTINI